MLQPVTANAPAVIVVTIVISQPRRSHLPHQSLAPVIMSVVPGLLHGQEHPGPGLKGC